MRSHPKDTVFNLMELPLARSGFVTYLICDFVMNQKRYWHLLVGKRGEGRLSHTEGKSKDYH